MSPIYLLSLINSWYDWYVPYVHHFSPVFLHVVKSRRCASKINGVVWPPVTWPFFFEKLATLAAGDYFLILFGGPKKCGKIQRKMHKFDDTRVSKDLTYPLLKALLSR